MLNVLHSKLKESDKERRLEREKKGKENTGVGWGNLSCGVKTMISACSPCPTTPFLSVLAPSVGPGASSGRDSLMQKLCRISAGAAVGRVKAAERVT